MTPRISVITVTYNSAKTIEGTLKSVLSQDYPALEYIIIDGGSTDATLDIINRYRGDIATIVSEPDRGISDAFNKGIRHATGEIVGIVNSDDLLLPGALQAIAEGYDPQVDVYSGVVMFWDERTGKQHPSYPDLAFDTLRLQYGVAHPARFVRRDAYERYGLFVEQLRYMMDIELLVRFYKQGARFALIDKPLAQFRLGGTTGDSIYKKKEDYRYFVRSYGGTDWDFRRIWAQAVAKYWLIQAGYRLFGDDLRFKVYHNPFIRRLLGYGKSPAPMRNKKIIRSVTVSQSCGFFRELAVKLRGMGYEVLPLSSPGAELDEMRDAYGFRTIPLPMERHVAPWRDLVALFRLVLVLLRERPLMVHSMTPKAGLLSMLAAWITRVPVRVHTFTGLVWPTATGLQRSILMLTDRLTCACATHIIPEGEGVKRDLLAGRITRKPMRILGHGNVRGIDLQRFDPQRLVRHPHAAFRFLFVGRIVGDKGVNELVEAFARLHSARPETELVLVGSQEPALDPLRPETMQMIADCPAIKMAGETLGDDLVQAYTDADCFVMPSYREGFPNTVIEAGAMSLPSVVTDINGSREIIADGKNGLIVPPRDARALHDAMLRLLDDDALRREMSREARPLVASRFDKTYVQQCLIDFYNEILTP